MRRRLFGRLDRPRAEVIEQPWPDQFNPPDRENQLYHVAHEHVSQHPSNVNVMRVTSGIDELAPKDPRIEIPMDAPPTPQVVTYARMRSGEGFWGLQSIIPEGEVE